jgi:hypothetical protein
VSIASSALALELIVELDQSLVGLIPLTEFELEIGELELTDTDKLKTLFLFKMN